MVPVDEMVARFPDSHDERPSLRVWVYAAALVLALVACVVLGTWSGSEKREIRNLPDAERRALYQRTLEDIQAVCGPGQAGDWSEHCWRQASFIIQFPECDESCKNLARRQLVRATR